MVGVIGAICCVLLAYAAATNTSKAGVYLNGCTDSAELFPLDDAHPAQWKSCNDAYEYTWMNDFGGFLKGMSLKNRMRLAYSMVGVAYLPDFLLVMFIGNIDSAGFLSAFKMSVKNH